MSEPLLSDAERYQSAVWLYSSGQFAEALAMIMPLVSGHTINERHWEVLNLAAVESRLLWWSEALKAFGQQSELIETRVVAIHQRQISLDRTQLWNAT